MEAVGEEPRQVQGSDEHTKDTEDHTHAVKNRQADPNLQKQGMKQRV